MSVDGERRQLRDALEGMLVAARSLVDAIGESRTAYEAGYDAGVCAALEVDVEWPRS